MNACSELDLKWIEERISKGLKPMAILKIVTVNDPDHEVLFKNAQRVRDFGPRLHQLLDDMIETMRAAPGVGLAAPQVGVSLRVAVIEYPEDEEDPENTKRLYEIINPEIIKKRGAEIGQEGCLSIPGLAADVERATQIVVRAQDRFGKEIRIKAYGWLARIFQHEIDHLAGTLMTDRAVQLYKLVKNADGEVDAIPLEQIPDFKSHLSPA
ncbi:peptide deformylase [Caldilinea sp.]|nr:peptide deformylase [Caldilinea sp.]MBO9393751.1 peptide deformylase [Caldilinea sp.]